MKQLVTELLSKLTDDEKKELKEALNEKPFYYTDIKTVEDACAHLGLPDTFCERRIDEPVDEWAYRLMKIVTKAINPTGWKAKFDGVQSNYFAYWSVLSSGFGFSGSTYYFGRTGATVGSRLYFSDSDRTKHFGKHFVRLAERFYIPQDESRSE